MRNRPLVFWYGLYVAPSFLGLTAVLLAIHAGGSPARLGPIAGFLSLWALGAAHNTVARRLFRQRALRQRQTSFPRGVAFKSPAWMAIDGALMMLALAAIPGTLVAIAGFPQVAAGIVLVGALFAAGASSGFTGLGALTFEPDGLRLRFRSAECLVSWASIRRIEPIGPERFTMLRLHIDDVDRVVASVLPDRESARKRVQAYFLNGEFLLDPWSGGIDGMALARALQENVDGAKERLN